MNIKKTFLSVLSATLVLGLSASAATHTVVRGDTMWKIADKYEVGTREIITANPEVKNPDLIYPGQRLRVPETEASVSSFEAEVIRLVNIERSKNGLSPLTHDWELSRVARYKSQDMKDKNYFSHTSPTYGSPFDMIKSFGISLNSCRIIVRKLTACAFQRHWLPLSLVKQIIFRNSSPRIIMISAKENALLPIYGLNTARSRWQMSEV